MGLTAVCGSCGGRTDPGIGCIFCNIRPQTPSISKPSGKMCSCCGNHLQPGTNCTCLRSQPKPSPMCLCGRHLIPGQACMCHTVMQSGYSSSGSINVASGYFCSGAITVGGGWYWTGSVCSGAIQTTSYPSTGGIVVTASPYKDPQLSLDSVEDKPSIQTWRDLPSLL